MKSRHFGIPNVRTGLGGNEHQPARSRANTPRDLYPLPSGSISNGDAPGRERAALTFVTVFLSLCFAIPMILAGIMMHFR